MQVSTTQDFANIIHTSSLVDETVYTAYAVTFPEGQLYWRVQALDNSNNALSFSPIRALVKNSPPPQLTLPAADATVTSSPTFRWDAQPFAARFEIEIYKNIDQALSSTNKLFSSSAITTRVNGYAPTAALPPGLYGWRLRRLDADARPGPWSAADNSSLRRFTSTGAAPELIAPVNNAVVADNDLLFSWNPSPGAATYRVEVSTSTDFSAVYDATPGSNTVMTSFSPTKQYVDGTYYWRVRALDGSSNFIGTSAVRVFAKDQSTLGEYFPLTPARIFDSRSVADGPALATTTRNVTVLGVGAVPATGVSAVVVNVTAVTPTAASWLTVWQAGATKPTASNLNYVAGQVIPNLVVVKVGSGTTYGGKISLANAAGTTHVIVDVVGWFGDGTNPRGARFQPTAVPARIFDSRSTTPIGAGLTRDVQVAGGGAGTVPATASAVVMNVTVVSPTASGWLTVYPKGVAQPASSNLNFTTGQVVPNLVVVKVGTNQSVTVFNSTGNTHVIFDVVGWYEGGDPGPGARFNPMAPLRLLDTRSVANAPSLSTGETRHIAVRGVGGAAGVPAAATSVVVNVTVTGPAASGWLTLWPSGALPVASNVNYVAGQTVPNLVVVKLAADGGVNLFSQARADVIFDVVGWYGG